MMLCTCTKFLVSSAAFILKSSLLLSSFFFFQAEDGIRDHCVTGVQTCALPIFDLIAQGFAGLMSITGEPGRPPVKTGNPVADINAGILAFGGILAAYVNKLKTGDRKSVV